jgi:hypothetical protein
MTFDIGHQVVVKLNGTHRVGVVSSRKRLKRGLVYSVILENGKTVDECSVNKILSDCHIVRGLTKTLKNEKRNNTQDDSEPTSE